MSGEKRSLDKKRPQYLLSATNVAQPNKKSNYKNSSKFRFIVLLSSWGKQPTVSTSVATKCLSPFLVLGLSSTLCPLTLFALNSACRLFTYWSAAGLVARDGRRSSTGPSASTSTSTKTSTSTGTRTCTSTSTRSSTSTNSQELVRTGKTNTSTSPGTSSCTSA